MRAAPLLAVAVIALALVAPIGAQAVPVVTMSKAVPFATEGISDPVFRLTRTSAVGLPSVNVECSGTLDAADFTAPPPSTAVFASGSSTADLQLQLALDGISERGEYVDCRIMSGTGYTVGSPYLVRIFVVDRDAATWSLAAGPDVVEGSLTSFQITRGNSQAQTTAVWPIAMSGTANRPQDYSIGNDVILQNESPYTATLLVSTVEDGVVEADETVELTAVHVRAWKTEPIPPLPGYPTMVSRGLGNATWLAGTHGGVWRSLGPEQWLPFRLTSEDARDVWAQDTDHAAVLYSDYLYVYHGGTWSRCATGIANAAFDNFLGYSHDGGGRVAGLIGTQVAFVHQDECGQNSSTCLGPTVAAGSRIVDFAGDTYAGHVLIQDPGGQYASYTSLTWNPCNFTLDFTASTATNYAVLGPTQQGNCGGAPFGWSAFIVMGDVLRCFAPEQGNGPAPFWQDHLDLRASNLAALEGGYAELGCTGMATGPSNVFEDPAGNVQDPLHAPGLVLNCAGATFYLDLADAGVTYAEHSQARPGVDQLACSAGFPVPQLPQHLQECVAITGDQATVRRSLDVIRPSGPGIRILDADSLADIAVDGIHDAQGNPAAGPWGAWTATPGDVDVASNYLAASNHGNAAGSLTLSFTDPDFTGPAGSTVPITGNVGYCHRETALAEPPGQGFTCDVPAAGSRAISLDIPAGRRVWVQYLLLQIPAAASDGSYVAAYTASAV